MFRSRLGVATVGSAAWAAAPRLGTRCEEESDVKQTRDPYSNEILAVYLTGEAKEQIDNFLTNRGITNREANFVCFRSANVRPDYTYIYSSLYGSKAAFRLKGLITVKDKTGAVEHLIGTGRLCNMVGEVKDDDFVVSLPLTKKRSSLDDVSGDECVEPPDLNLLLDIPTRLDAMSDKEGNKVISQNQWKGSLTYGKVLDRTYWRLNNVSYWALPKKLQIVVDGTLCSSAYWDGLQGGCNYNRDVDYDSQVLGPKSSFHKASDMGEDADQANSGSNSNDGKKEERECPVCAYIKAGPCKEPYLVWAGKVDQTKPGNGQQVDDEKLRQVLDSATDMLRCMVKYEYYDMMTANTDLAALESIKPKAH